MRSVNTSMSKRTTVGRSKTPQKRTSLSSSTMKFQAALSAVCLSAYGASAFTPKTIDLEASTFFVEKGGGGFIPKSIIPFTKKSSPTSKSISTPRPSTFSTPLVPGRRSPAPQARSRATPQAFKNIWNEDNAEIVQGTSLKTWSFMSPAVERVQVMLKTEGRPLNADVELWQGPDNTPQKMAVYLEDGDVRPFACVIESPRGSNTVSVRNTANLEFPLMANVEPDVPEKGRPPLAMAVREMAVKRGKVVQGGAIVTYPFDPSVAKVSVMMRTDGRPLNARIELLQGPNNNKQVVDVYTEDGMERPFQLILDTPGTGNVVRIINTATVEFPLTASVEPFLIEEYKYDDMLGGRSLQSMNNGLVGRTTSMLLNERGENDFFYSRD